MGYVQPHDDMEQVQRAIAVPMPTTLTSEDGRKFQLTGWHPHVVINDIVRVTIEANIEMPDDAP